MTDSSPRLLAQGPNVVLFTLFITFNTPPILGYYNHPMQLTVNAIKYSLLILFHRFTTPAFQPPTAEPKVGYTMS